MSQKTAIQWTDATWNPVVGCTRISAGCKNCYAHQLHDMRYKAFHDGKKLPAQYEAPFTTIQTMPARLEDPIHWKKPHRIFVNSVSDLFHESVSFEFIAQVWTTMAICHWHTFQILTKRPQRALDFFEWTKGALKEAGLDEWWKGYNILPNVQIGVSVENQPAADERISLLARIPASVRFLSCEPLLGPLDLEPWFPFSLDEEMEIAESGGEIACSPNFINWVIVGGESGAGARPMHPAWARSLRDQCQAAGVPFFFKQWGEFIHNGEPPEWNKQTFHRVGKKAAGRLLDGREWNEFPNPHRTASGNT